MEESILLRIQIVEDLLSQIPPMLNKVSASAFFVQQGRFDQIRPSRQLLEKWCVQYGQILPESVGKELFFLSRRLSAI